MNIYLRLRYLTFMYVELYLHYILYHILTRFKYSILNCNYKYTLIDFD